MINQPHSLTLHPKMELQFALHVLALCFIFSVLTQGKRGKKLEETLSFDVKPSGQVAHQSIKLENGVTCVFTYAAVGGTNEEWTMTLSRAKKTYTCTIERPDQTSYLYFMNFAASVLEHTVETAEVFDNTGALLQGEEFIITDDDRSVKYKDGEFQSNLAKIVLTAHAKHP